MNISLIDIVLLLTKWLTYIAIAIEIGGGFILYLTWSNQRLRTFTFKYMQMGIVFGLMSSIAYFLGKVGIFASDGLRGFFDIETISLLWQIEIGAVLRWRLIALTLCLTSISLLRLLNVSHPRNAIKTFSICLFFAGSVIFAYSYTLLGHTVEINIFARLLLALHVIVMGVWLGSLYPLYVACNVYKPNKLKVIMQRFGELAMIFVGVLAAAGTIMLIMLLGSFTELFTTSYGRMMLLKLGFVCCILSLAAWHKLRLVPRLSENRGVQTLKKSIVIEINIALLILLSTALVTSIFGPLKLS